MACSARAREAGATWGLGFPEEEWWRQLCLVEEELVAWGLREKAGGSLTGGSFCEEASGQSNWGNFCYVPILILNCYCYHVCLSTRQYAFWKETLTNHCLAYLKFNKYWNEWVNEWMTQFIRLNWVLFTLRSVVPIELYKQTGHTFSVLGKSLWEVCCIVYGNV